MPAYQVISEAVKNQGIKLTFLSTQTGIALSKISSSLNGKRTLTGDELVKLATILNLEMSEFMKNAG